MIIDLVKFETGHPKVVLETERCHQVLAHNLCKVQSGPLTGRARRDGGVRQTTPDWQVAALISKGNYIWGLSRATAKSVDLHNHQNARISQEALGFSHRSPTHSSLKVGSFKRLWLSEWWSECTFQRQGKGEEPPNAGVQLEGQLAVTSSHRPPLTPRAQGFSSVLPFPTCWLSSLLPRNHK